MAEPVPLTIRKSWTRPAPAAIDALRGVPTGFVADALGRSGALDHRITPVWDGPAFVGSALPVGSTARDNLAPYAALTVAQPGDVMLIATGEYDRTSVIGDLVIGMMRNNGIVACVTDGLVRDVAGIREVGIPVYARGVSPNSPFKHGPGTIGLPIAIGGVPVKAGDVVLGDSDGVVVVPAERLDEAVRELAAIKVKEAEMDASVRGGARKPAWLDAVMAAARYVD